MYLPSWSGYFGYTSMDQASSAHCELASESLLCMNARCLPAALLPYILQCVTCIQPALSAAVRLISQTFITSLSRTSLIFGHALLKVQNLLLQRFDDAVIT